MHERSLDGPKLVISELLWFINVKPTYNDKNLLVSKTSSGTLLTAVKTVQIVVNRTSLKSLYIFVLSDFTAQRLYSVLSSFNDKNWKLYSNQKVRACDESNSMAWPKKTLENNFMAIYGRGLHCPPRIFGGLHKFSYQFEDLKLWIAKNRPKRPKSEKVGYKA